MPDTQNPLQGALVVSLSISQWGNTVVDAGITSEVQHQKEAGSDSGEWRKKLLPKEFLRPITQKAGDIRRWVADNTRRWEDGRRLVTPQNVEAFRQQMAEHAGQFRDTVERQCLTYKTSEHAVIGWIGAIEHARDILGRMFNRSDYPQDALTFIKAHSVNVCYEPPPNPADIQDGIFGAMAQQLREEIQARNEERIAQGTAEVWQRLIQPVQHMAAVLLDPKKRVLESVLTNIQEICDVIPSLALGGRTDLLEAAQSIREQLTAISTEELKASPLIRREVAEKAAGFVARFGQLGTRKLDVPIPPPVSEPSHPELPLAV